MHDTAQQADSVRQHTTRLQYICYLPLSLLIHFHWKF